MSDPPAESAPARRKRARGTWLGLALLAAAYAYTTWPARDEIAGTWLTDLPTALETARREQKPVLLYVYAQGCPACAWMNSEVFARPEMQRALAGWVLVRVEGQKQAGFSAAHKVDGFPTLILLSPDGRELTRALGAVPPDELLSLLGTTATFPG